MKSVKMLNLVLTIALLVIGCAHGKGGLVESRPQTTCPVMGGKINKEVYADYEGKRVYFCCGGCINGFRKDPVKYVKKLEGEGVTLENANEASSRNESSQVTDAGSEKRKAKGGCGCCSK